MVSPEFQDPFKRRGSRFLERRNRIIGLLSEGRLEDAVRLTGQKHARVINFLFKQKPDIRIQEVANVLQTSWITAKRSVNNLKDIGFSLNSPMS